MIEEFAMNILNLAPSFAGLIFAIVVLNNIITRQGEKEEKILARLEDCQKNLERLITGSNK